MAVEKKAERKSWSNPLQIAAVVGMHTAGLVVVCEELAKCQRVKWEWEKWQVYGEKGELAVVG